MSIFLSKNLVNSPDDISGETMHMLPDQVFLCAKALLGSIEFCSKNILSIEDWLVVHPQQEQAGKDRIEDICKYKVIHGLTKHVLSNNQKISKMFGISYLRWGKQWMNIRDHTIKNIADKVGF